MANNVKKVNTIAIASIGKINGQNDSDLVKLNGEEFTKVPPVWSGTRAILHGAYTYTWTPTHAYAGGGWVFEDVQYKTLDSDAATADFGNLLEARAFFRGSGSNGTRTVAGCGNNLSSRSANIDYTTAASLGEVYDHGDLDVATSYGCPDGGSNGTIVLFCGGNTAAGSTAVIEEMTIASSGASDNGGELQSASKYQSASLGDSKCLILDEVTASGKEDMSQHSFTSGADASAYGNVASVPTSNIGTVCSSDRVVYGGGTGGTAGGSTKLDTIQWFAVAGGSDSTDAANLIMAISGSSGTSDKTRGEFYGGIAGSPNVYIRNEIQKIAIASISGTAGDVDDLTFPTGADTYTTAGGAARISSQTAS